MLNVNVSVCKIVNQINSLNVMQSYLKKFDIPIDTTYFIFYFETLLFR